MEASSPNETATPAKPLSRGRRPAVVMMNETPGSDATSDMDIDHGIQTVARKYWKPLIAGVVLLLAIFLLTARLGHAALWDDECYTALLGEGICQTGDTSVVLGHNLLAFGYGFSVRNLKDRFFPPLPFYLAAAALKVFGYTAFAARFPFAVCGILTFALIIFWLWKDQADVWTWIIVLFALLVNVSFLLYFRQSRYYGVTILMSVFAAFVYLHWPSKLRWQWLLVVAMTALLASNYMNVAGAAACLGADWLLWGRKHIRVPWRNMLILGVTQFIIGAVLLWVWNPLGVKPPVWNVVTPTLALKAQHLWWNVRDMSVNEFFIGPLLLLAPGVWLRRRDPWLGRGMVAVIVYFACVSFFAPRGEGGFAEVRYFCPMIPLFVVVEARTLLGLVRGQRWLAVILAVPLFGVNLLSGSMIFKSGAIEVPIRSTILAYLRELRDPPTECYTVTANWIHANLATDQTVLVLPQYATYPLMFRAPQQVYAWQLPNPPPPQFEGFAASQYEGVIPPMFIIVFGREGLAGLQELTVKHPIQIGYSLRATLPVFSMDLLKPELFLHNFDGPLPMDPRVDAVYVLERN